MEPSTKLLKLNTPSLDAVLVMHFPCLNVLHVVCSVQPSEQQSDGDPGSEPC